MKISTEISSFGKYGSPKEIIALLKKVGFTAYDFSMFTSCGDNRFIDGDDYIERAKELRKYADEIGIKCNQAHAPFPTAIKGNEEYNEKVFPEICRALETAGILGAKVCVVHPCNDYTPEENAELYKKFEQTARRAGVKIGLENMWNWNNQEGCAAPAACSDAESFVAHLKLLPSDVFVACLDLGHAEMKGLNTNAAEMILSLGDRLEALHVHDNDCWHDDHTLPYIRNMNFEVIIDALRKVHYSGDITLESDTFIRRFPMDFYPVAAKFMADVAKYIKNQSETK